MKLREMTIKNLTSLQKQIEVFNNDFSQKRMQDQQSLLDLSKVDIDLSKSESQP